MASRALAYWARMASGKESRCIGCLILLAPFVWGQNGLSVCVSRNTLPQPCRPECLDRAPIHPGEVERGYKQWCSPVPLPWRIPTVSGELLCSTPFSVQSPLFIVGKMDLCRSNLHVHFMCCVILGSWMESTGTCSAWGALAQLPGVAQQGGWKARCPWWCLVCCSFCSLCLEAKGHRWHTWEWAVVILQVRQSTEYSSCLPYGGGRVCKQYNTVFSHLERCYSSQKVPIVSQPCLWGLFLLFIVQKLFIHSSIVSQE